jgi:iron-sulfur cluster assembly accessory protein
MVEVSAEAIKFINDLLEKNNKKGYGIRIYLAGMGCSGPQFGMAFQEKKNTEDTEQKVNGFSFYYDNETKEMLEGSTVDYIETPNGSGLIVNNPNLKSACGAGCAGCH